MRLIPLSCAALLAAWPLPGQTEAERVVQAYHDAYNRHDAVAVLAVYAPDAVVIQQPADTLYRGTAELRQDIKRDFVLMPRLSVEVRSRTAEGNTVVDELFWSGFPCGGTYSERVEFQVQDGLIRSVTRTLLGGDVVAAVFAGGAPTCYPAGEESSGKPPP